MTEKIKKYKQPGQYSVAQLKRAEARRQAVLQYLNANGPSTFEQLCSVLPDQKEASMRGAISGMLRIQEIAATGPKRAHVYIALVSTTRSAEHIRSEKTRKTNESSARQRKLSNVARDARREAKRIADREREDELRKNQCNVAPGHYRHDPDKFRHYPSGGQGAVRRDVFVNCEQFY